MQVIICRNCLSFSVSPVNPKPGNHKHKSIQELCRKIKDSHVSGGWDVEVPLDSGAESEISIGDILRYQPNLRRSKWWGETNIALPGSVPCFHMFPWTSGSSRSRSTPNSCPNHQIAVRSSRNATDRPHKPCNLPQEFPEFPRHHFSIPDSSKCGWWCYLLQFDIHFTERHK